MKSTNQTMADPDKLIGEESMADAAETTNTNVPLTSPSSASDIDSTSASASGEGLSPTPETFVNNGLKQWQAAREAWCGRPSTTANGEDVDYINNHESHRRAVPIDVDGVIDVLFDPRWRGGVSKLRLNPVPPRFPTNVPLPQMIDVLTDLWEAEGLDV